ALGAVDDEGAVVGHERHIAHVDVLLLDVADRARAGFLVDVPHHELERDLERRGKGDAALLALLDVVLRLFEFVLHELEAGALGEVLDREHAAKDLLQARRRPLCRGDRALEEVFVGALLDLDQVWHGGHGLDVAEETTDSFARIEGRGHPASSIRFKAGELPAAVSELTTRQSRSSHPLQRATYRSGPQVPKNRCPLGKGARAGRPKAGLHGIPYLSSTLAPSASSLALSLSASAFGTPSLTGFGAPSTRSLASLRPRPVISRTALMTLMFLSPAAASTTVNSSFTSAGAAAAAPGAAAAATGAAALTPHFSSSNLLS